MTAKKGRIAPYAILLSTFLSCAFPFLAVAGPEDEPAPRSGAIPAISTHTDSLGWEFINFVFGHPEYGISDLEEIAIHGPRVTNPDPTADRDAQHYFDQRIATQFNYFAFSSIHHATFGLERDYRGLPRGAYRITLTGSNNYLPYQLFALAESRGLVLLPERIPYHTSESRLRDSAVADFTVNYITAQYQAARAAWSTRHPNIDRAFADIPGLLEMLINPPAFVPRSGSTRPYTLPEAEREAAVEVLRRYGADPLRSQREARNPQNWELAQAEWRRLTYAILELRNRPNRQRVRPSFEEILEYVKDRIHFLSEEAVREYLRDFPEGSILAGSGGEDPPVPMRPADYRLPRERGPNGSLLSALSSQWLAWRYRFRAQDGRDFSFWTGGAIDIEASEQRQLVPAMFHDRLISSAQISALNSAVNDLQRALNGLTSTNIRSKIPELRMHKNKFVRGPDHTFSDCEAVAFYEWFSKLFNGGGESMLRFGLMTYLAVDPNFLARQSIAREAFSYNELFADGINEIFIPNMNRTFYRGLYGSDDETTFFRNAWRTYVRRLQGFEPTKVETSTNRASLGRGQTRPRRQGTRSETAPSAPRLVADPIDSLSIRTQPLGASFRNRGPQADPVETGPVIRLSRNHANNVYFYGPNPAQSFSGWTPTSHPAQQNFAYEVLAPRIVVNSMVDILVPIGYEIKQVEVIDPEGRQINPANYILEIGVEDSAMRLRFVTGSPESITYRVFARRLEPSEISEFPLSTSAPIIESVAAQAEAAGLSVLAESLRAETPRTGEDLVRLVHLSSLYSLYRDHLPDEAAQIPAGNIFSPFAPFIRAPYLIGACFDHNRLLAVLATALDPSARFLPERGILVAKAHEDQIPADRPPHAAQLFVVPGKGVSYLDGTSPHVINESTNNINTQASQPTGSSRVVFSGLSDFFDRLFAWTRRNTQLRGNSGGTIEGILPPGLTEEARAPIDPVTGQSPAPPIEPINPEVEIPMADRPLDASNPLFLDFIGLVHEAWAEVLRTLSEIESWPSSHQKLLVARYNEGPTLYLLRFFPTFRYLAGLATIDPESLFKPPLVPEGEDWRAHLPRFSAQNEVSLRQTHDGLVDPGSRLHREIVRRYPFLTQANLQRQLRTQQAITRVLRHPLFSRRLSELPEAIRLLRPLPDPCQGKYLPSSS